MKDTSKLVTERNKEKPKKGAGERDRPQGQLIYINMANNNDETDRMKISVIFKSIK